MIDDPYRPPQADVMGLGPAPAAGGPYEFSERENASIARTGSRCRLWGLTSIVLGVLCLLGLVGAVVAIVAVGGAATLLISALVSAVLLPFVVVLLSTGLLYVGAGRALGLVVETQGNDVELLVGGLARLTGAFRVEVIATVVSYVLIVAAAVVAFLAAIAGGAQ